MQQLPHMQQNNKTTSNPVGRAVGSQLMPFAAAQN
jgi:hypothetical protein